jgi:hypothetical protein
MGQPNVLSPEEAFWRWFQEHSERLQAFEADREAVFDEVAAALHDVDEGLTFEFGPIRDGRREFVVSADGIKEHFPAVRRLVAVAPVLPLWVVTPFRPPASLELVVEYAGASLGPDDVWFSAAPDAGRVGLTLFVRGLTEENRRTLSSAGYILLDNALGEYAVETQVGFIEWSPLPNDPEASGLMPFRRIREPFDTVVH